MARLRCESRPIDAPAMTPDARYLSYPTRLEAEDFAAILAQAVDPEVNYRERDR